MADHYLMSGGLNANKADEVLDKNPKATHLPLRNSRSLPVLPETFPFKRMTASSSKLNPIQDNNDYEDQAATSSSEQNTQSIGDDTTLVGSSEDRSHLTVPSSRATPTRFPFQRHSSIGHGRPLTMESIATYGETSSGTHFEDFRSYSDISALPVPLRVPAAERGNAAAMGDRPRESPPIKQGSTPKHQAEIHDNDSEDGAISQAADYYFSDAALRDIESSRSVTSAGARPKSDGVIRSEPDVRSPFADFKFRDSEYYKDDRDKPGDDQTTTVTSATLPPHPGVRPFNKQSRSRSRAARTRSAVLSEARRLSFTPSDLMYPPPAFWSTRPDSLEAVSRTLGQTGQTGQSRVEDPIELEERGSHHPSHGSRNLPRPESPRTLVNPHSPRDPHGTISPRHSPLFPIEDPKRLHAAKFQRSLTSTARFTNPLHAKKSRASFASTSRLTDPPSPTHPDFHADDNGPPDGGRLAWAIAWAGFFVTFNTWGLNNAFGAFQAYYALVALRGQASLDKIAWIGGMQLFLIFFVGTPIGFTLDREMRSARASTKNKAHKAFRLLFHGGTALLLLGVLLTSICGDSFWKIFVTQGVVTGLGMGCVFTTGAIVLMGWFKKKIGLAMGLGAAGASCGTVCYALVFQRLMMRGWSFGSVVRCMGFLAAATLVFPNLIVRPYVGGREEEEEERGRKRKRETRDTLDGTTLGRATPKTVNGTTTTTTTTTEAVNGKEALSELIRDKAYLVMAAGYFLVFWGMFFGCESFHVFSSLSRCFSHFLLDVHATSSTLLPAHLDNINHVLTFYGLPALLIISFVPALK